MKTKMKENNSILKSKIIRQGGVIHEWNSTG